MTRLDISGGAGTGTVIDVTAVYPLTGGSITTYGNIGLDTAHVYTAWHLNNYFQPKITAGTIYQYYRGDKTWQTLPLTYWNKTANYLTPNGINRVMFTELFDSSGFPQQTNRMVLDPDHYRIIFSLNQRVGGSGPPPLQIQDSLIFVHPYPADPIDFATLYSPGELNLGTKAHPIDTIHYTYLDPPISSGGDTTWHDDGYSAHKQTSKRDTVVIKSILTHTIGGADLEVENPITFKDMVILKKGKRLESGAGWIFGSDTSIVMKDSIHHSATGNDDFASLELIKGRQVVMKILNDPAPPAKENMLYRLIFAIDSTTHNCGINCGDYSSHANFYPRVDTNTSGTYKKSTKYTISLGRKFDPFDTLFVNAIYPPIVGGAYGPTSIDSTMIDADGITVPELTRIIFYQDTHNWGHSWSCMSPQIASGTPGQMITLFSLNYGRFKLLNACATVLTGDFDMSCGDNITLVYSSYLSAWVEVCRTDITTPCTP